MFQSGTEAVSSVIFYLNPVLCLQMMAALYRVVCLYNKNKVRLRDLFLWFGALIDGLSLVQ